MTAKSGEGTAQKTVLHEWHVAAGATMHEFGGYDMPIQYEAILAEHLATRRVAGLFDTSHMGRYRVSGPEGLAFLQRALTNNALALDRPGTAQYTLLSDESGAAVDDAYLYRRGEAEYLLVVNAGNRAKDWDWLQGIRSNFPGAVLEDLSDELAMMALQGPASERILEILLADRGSGGRLPEPRRNALSAVTLDRQEVLVARTGYTGEPVCFELFPPAGGAVALWERLLAVGRDLGAVPVGLGARDTLRLEAGLPLYGHELGMDPEGKPIPIFALLSLANSAVSFSPAKGEYVGREALQRQHEEVQARLRGGRRSGPPPGERRVPRFVRRLAVLNPERTGPGVNPVRQGHRVLLADRPVGWVTSGTTVPYLRFAGSGLGSVPEATHDKRAIALAYLDAELVAGRAEAGLVAEKAPGRTLPVQVVTANLRATPPFARAVLHPEPRRGTHRLSRTIDLDALAAELVARATANARYRQRETVNLIPSEQSPSLFVRLLCSLDPTGRYAEHKQVRAFGRQADDIFYYQGTGFISWVEEATQAALGQYLGCSEVEVRPISGQMANKTVFAGLVDHLNRFGKGEPRRFGPVVNNHLGRGGHLSAQYLGALRHYVRRDPRTDRPAVVSFPVLADDPFRLDVAAACRLIEEHRPELVILGKSLVLYPEPVAEIAALVADWPDRPLLLYDMAHVLGLVGPHFQEPFAQGADLVTGSTHKTFFGPQRGIVAGKMAEGSLYRPLWERIQGEAFPGAVSNHHPGTLLGLLGATYEMLAFKDEYQPQVLANARAFARALADCGLRVQGEAAAGFTRTHQVILDVGHGRGPAMAAALEENRVIANYQALPWDVSFSDASGIRMGTQEMTRFGMREADFGELAGLMAEVILRQRPIGPEVTALRSRFTRMRYTLPVERTEELLATLRDAAGWAG
ncbi:MAG: glycine cleavage system protein T [Candidatus Latescibacterota bacterium]|jgi:aminomethyltransferase